MKEAPIAKDDARRVASLHQTDLLDSAPEERFDRLTRMAKQIFDVPIALISLVDTDRQWFKSKIGIAEAQTSRCISFCGHAILRTGLFVVENALVDERFFDNPLVTGEFGLRFYAGRPIRVASGEIIGTLCIIDTKPRRLSSVQRMMLEDLGKLVENEIGLQPNPPRARKHKGSSLPDNQANHGKNENRYWRLPPIVQWIGKPRIAELVSFLVGLLVLAVVITWYDKDMETYRTNLTSDAVQLSSTLRGKIETELNSRLHLTYALAGFVRANEQINETQFQMFASEMSKGLSSVRSLQLAPDGIVTHVWPYELNQGAIGHDLLADPDRRKAAQNAIDTRNIWLAGPLNLVQGGTAIIGRFPIFRSDSQRQSEYFWGFATVLIDLPEFIHETGLDNPRYKFEIALRGRDGEGKLGDIFFGKAESFANPAALSSISLPAGSWEIAVSSPPDRVEGVISPTFWVMSVLSLLLIPLLTYMLLRLPRRFERAVEEATLALEQSEVRFRDAIEALSDGFVIYDRNDQLLTCNQQYREIYSKSRELIQEGRNYEEILAFGYDKGQYDKENLQGCSRDEFIQRSMSRHRSPGQFEEEKLESGRWIKLVERPIRGGGTVGLRIDITEQKQKQIELAKAKENAEAASRAKSAFLATVSHEVRTPMNVMLGLLELLKDSRHIQGTEKNYINTAFQSANQLLHILNEILDLSKVEAGKLELENEPFDFLSVVNSVIELSKNQAEDKNILLQLVQSNVEYPVVKGDAGRLHQILLNIVNNAVKFTDRGKVLVSVKQILRGKKQCRLIVKVKDTGVGFSKIQAKELFKPFSQIDNGASRRYEGAGLGLSICKELVNLMGGKISAEGWEGDGATFTVELPLEIVDSSTLENVKKPLESENSKMEGSFKILIAEDSPSNRIVFDAVLANCGYSIDMVENGLEAVKAIQKENYDLVLMDIYMPKLNGIEATKEIRDSLLIRNLPIIALTANAMKGDRERFMEAGMDDYLPKPISKDNLIRKIEEWRSKTAAL